MPSNWIRVDASIGRDARLAKARRILGVSRAEMVGMHVLLEAELLAQHQTGILTDVEVSTLAEWAAFEGDLKHFQKAIEALSDNEGRLFGWTERHDVLLHRLEREAERKRKTREAQRVAREGAKGAKRASEGRPKDGGKTAAGRPNGTERNGTERDDTETLDSSESTNKRLSELERGGNATASAAADLRSKSNSELLQLLGNRTLEFFNRFYPKKGTHIKRYRDVLEQLAMLATGLPVTYKKQAVFAYDVDRLDVKCAEVLDQTDVVNLDSAIALLLVKLGDTSDGSAPGEREAETRSADTALDEELSTQVVSDWEAENPFDAQLLYSEIAAEYDDPNTEIARIAIKAEFRSRVVARLIPDVDPH